MYRRPTRLGPAIGLFLALATAIAIAPGCREAPPGEEIDPAFTDLDAQAVVQAHKQWVQAYESGDIEGLIALLDERPYLLIFHPRLRNRFDGVDELPGALEEMFTRIGPVSWTDFHSAVTVQGSVGWLTSEVLLESPALDPPLAVRGTEIWVRTEDGWRLTHGHWSATPER